MKHSKVHNKHTHHHSNSESRGVRDSRPLPLLIPNRRSDVRHLINFFNNHAFRTNGQVTPRRMLDPVPPNKVRSLVVDFNRRGPSSFPTTAVSSPLEDTYQWRGPRTRTNSMWTRSAPALIKQPPMGVARGVERPQFGKPLNIKPAEKDQEDIEEITVSGGDKRETTYRKSQEPFRSVKVWKEEFDSRESRVVSVVQGLGEEYSEQPQSSESRPESREQKERHHTHRHRSRKSKTPVDGPSVANEEAVEEMPPSRNRRRKHKTRGPSFQDDRYSSTQDSRPSPVSKPVPKQKTKQRNQRLQKSTSSMPGHQESAVSTHRTYASQKSRSLIPEPQGSMVSAYRPQESFVTTQEPARIDSQGDRVPTKSPKPNATTGDDTSPTSKRSFTGTLKGSLMSVFGRARREDNLPQKKQTSFLEATGSSDRKVRGHLRKLVPGEFEKSSWSETSSGYESNSSARVQDQNLSQPEKFPTIMTTEATPIESTPPEIGAVLEGGKVKAKVAATTEGLHTTSSPDYPTSTIRQPRTFKDIALQRREERKKAAESLTPFEPHEQLSVSPLRVIKSQDPVAPTLQKPEPPLRPLYEKASRETLTSFEEPSIHVLESSPRSSSSLLSEVAGPMSNKPRDPIEPDHLQVSNDKSRPPLRSPSLMREMAVPRLTLRIPSSKQSSIRQFGTNNKVKSKRPALTQQQFTPRMKLRGDSDWMKRPQRPQGNPLMDGFAGVSTTTLLPVRRRVRQRRSARGSASSSTSHDTTGSSEIARSSRKRFNIQPLTTQPETPLSDVEELRNDIQRDSDYRLVSSVEVRRSKVNFLSTTENFPAVDYPTGEDERQIIGDRTTVLDGAGESRTVGVEEVRLNVDGVRGKVQKIEEQRVSSRGRTKKKRKAYRDRPRILG
ncbi:hypothetical protein K440DRAFT_670918 [Wilcoxina mikolae CBS 423.85]|nr:hypothetical protein K440DRAFT_670918 [Wilcoxina mikolae CBS 423.85]